MMRDKLVAFTEGFLTRRRQRQRIKKEKQDRRHWIIDWLDAFLWAALVVLLLNQYLLQAYQIPSGSMIDTLKINDRIFVNKLVLGPELIPGMAKVPSPVKAQRGDVIIFENPTYLTKGPLFDIAQRVIYMLTFSLVDIDRTSQGEPSPHFLIKRYVGAPGDHIRYDQGDFLFKPRGALEWRDEETLKKEENLTYHNSRDISREAYPLFQEAARAYAYQAFQSAPPEEYNQALEEISRRGQSGQGVDFFYLSQGSSDTLWQMAPHNRTYLFQAGSYREGWYLPGGWMLPLGDNRDHSRDGRYFGPVKRKDLLGRAMFIYWPLSRWGSIR